MFDHVLSHDKPKKIITNLINANRFPQSLLFYGPKGIGKFLLAKSIAKYFNCPNENIQKKGTDDCSVCSRIDRELYPDFFIIKTEKTVTKSGKEKDSKVIKLDQVKEIARQVQFKPFEGDNKFFIIDGAETMHHTAENAFLKTLEEPLPNNYFILIAHNINKMIPTILSRCIKIKFNSINETILKKIIKKQYELDDELAEKISFLSNGSMSNAELLINGDVYKEIFEILKEFLKIFASKDYDLDYIFSLSSRLEKSEMIYMDYLFDLLLLYLHSIYMNKKHNYQTVSFVKYNLNLELKNIKLQAYNNIIDIIIKSKYYLYNTNINIKLLIENLIVKIKENIS